MKNIIKHQEILLVTHSRFVKNFCYSTSNINFTEDKDYNYKIEEACWKGLLSEMFPDLNIGTKNHDDLILWHIRHGINSLQIELSKLPPAIDKNLSIDISFFVPTISKN